MTLARLVGILVGAALIYSLRYVLDWPWYAAVPLAIVGYLMVRFAFESLTKIKGPTA